MSFGAKRASTPRKVFSENHVFHQFAKVFSLKSFPLYSILWGSSLLMTTCNRLYVIDAYKRHGYA